MPPIRRSWADAVPADLGGVGGGPSGQTAYDQTAPAVTDALAAQGGAPAPGGGQQPVPDAPSGVLASLGAQNTDQLTGDQIAQLAGGTTADTGATQATSPDEAAFQQMQAALEDPQTPPDVKAQIEQQIALAAKRQMLGGT